uniref:N-acylethanolamine-hydrolyzing acid amidase-like n=1 Tax=Styela clava TaxID=7725 RepID=UPI00193956F8|nr:N-acylethanolamine-hydrolyzing acid amidase-like [Styela clava]
MKTFLGLILVFIVFSFNVVESKNAMPAKRYKVNLDDDPMTRWVPLLENFDRSLLLDAIDSLLKQYVKNDELIALAEIIAHDLDKYISQPYADEMRGISKFYKAELGKVVLGNLAYDASAWNTVGKACTSIVTIDKTGGIIHGRNLDYGAGDELRTITTEVEFHRSGKTLFIGTTYVGYVGLLTAEKVNAFTISGDERDTGYLWENILSALTKGWPTMLMAREVITNAENFESAIEMLQKAKTIAPMYFIVGGVKPHEGAIIVRDRWGAINVTRMDDTYKWFVVETNYDPWNPPPSSDDRRDPAIKLMEEIGQNQMNPENLYKVLSTSPILNPTTTYTTVMSAKNTSLYHTMVRWDHPNEN